MPDWRMEVRRRLRGSRLPAEREAEIVEELAQDLEQRYDDLRLRGADHEAACRQVLDALEDGGRLSQNLNRVERQGTLEVSGPAPLPAALPAGASRPFWLPALQALGGEVRYGLRALSRTPAFAVTTVLVLALGIGANTAVFSVLHGVLLRPLPFADDHELVRIWSSREDRNLPFFSVSLRDYVDWQQRTEKLSMLAAYERQRPAILRGTEGVEQVLATSVTPNVFPLLGVSPLVGRWLALGGGAEGGSEAVISHGLWQRRFGGRSDVLGVPIVLDDRAWTIVGVMPSHFAIPNAPSDVWLPLEPAVDPAQRARRSLRVLGRVRPRHGVEDARLELDRIASALEEEYPDSNRFWGVTVRALVDTVVSPEFRRSVWLLAGAVVFVLLIACANVTSLLLARATARQREMAIRTALGASRASLVRLLLVESFILAVAAGSGGVLLATWGARALKGLSPDSIPRIEEVGISPPVLAFAGAVTLLTAVIFGLAPAFAGSSRTSAALRSRDSSVDARGGRSRDVLVVAEVALAVVLLVGAGLMMRSFMRVQQRPLGFDAAGLIAAQVAAPSTENAQEDFTVLAERILSRLGALPGVAAVAGGSRLPFAGPNSANVFEIEGVPFPKDDLPDTDYRIVTAGYFKAMGIPVVRGRAFTPGDGSGGPVVIISAALARRHWPAGDPIGVRVRLGSSSWMTIVGVAGDVRYYDLEGPEEALRSMMYMPHQQRPEVPLMFAIRTPLDAAALVGPIRIALGAAAPEAPVARIETMPSILSQAFGPRRFSTTLMGLFAGTALVLAAVGLYGLIAYVVSRQTRDIGVRLALGANASDVLRLTAGRGAALAATGLVLGIGGAWGLTRLLSRILFEVSPTDPVTFGLVAGVFLLVTTAASYVPARRALRINAVEVLRAE